jgi:tetratricopeptide (TPR) repeat protein
LRASLRQSCRRFRAGLEDMKRCRALIEKAIGGEDAMAVNNAAYFAGMAVEFEPGKPLEDEQLLLSMLAACEQAVKSSADESSIVDTRGYLHYLLGNYATAIVDFDKAIAKGEKELEEGRKRIEERAREAYILRQALREDEYSLAVMLGHRMKAHQKSGNSTAAKKDRDAIVALGFNPDLPLN